ALAAIAPAAPTHTQPTRKDRLQDPPVHATMQGAHAIHHDAAPHGDVRHGEWLSGISRLFAPERGPTPPSSRRWPARSRPANLPERNGSPPPSSRSALATRG